MTLTQLLQKVEERASQTAQFIVSGNCTSFEEYKSNCARVRAFQETISIATEPEKKTDSESTEN